MAELKEEVQTEKRKLLVTAPPHISHPDTTQKIMFTVVLSLLPIVVYDIYLFKIYAIITLFFSVFGAVFAEALIQQIRRMPSTISDGSAFLTGVLFALTLPPKVPWWISFIGGFVAIAIGKQAFGGLGYNVFNPALVGRIFVLLSWPKHLTSDWYDKVKLDAVTGATPMFVAKQFYLGSIKIDLSKFYEVHFFKNPYGSMGEASALLILVGFFILLLKRIIDYSTPLTYVATVGVLTALAGRDPIFYVLGGGLLFGAVFMATDYVTTPITRKGKVLFGFGAGVMTFLLRIYANTPEAVAYSILFMNALTPLIDIYTKPRVFGAKKR
ncbi:MAG: RnfABCDGE type electron transport complex subunit D [Actinobacteria bacterium]|nr:RnfABCDGE type electron transport complex subunit D [Actinomycetota bacterium]